MSTRRQFVGGAIGAALTAGIARGSAAVAKLPVAALVTTYGPVTHADVIVGKILEGYAHDGGPGPNLKLASLYVDQRHPKDMSRGLAEKHKFRIAGSIDEALTLGGDRLAVSGVLIIGEHGDYPDDPRTGQKLYPRKKFFDEVAATFRRVGQVAPIFNDKHLSADWAGAKQMVDTAREMKIPFMAGSSLPVCWRIPPLELERNCELDDALALGYGPLEGFGFHTLEVLQCMVERRRGGETGVKRIEAVAGDAIWEAQRAGRWSRELFDAALARVPVYRAGTPEKLMNKNAAFFLIEYRDGFRATVAMANGVTDSWAFAAKQRGKAEPVSTWVACPERAPFANFTYLLQAIEPMFRSGRPSYPIERTLLTTGMINAAMRSLAEGRPIETPHLDVRYEPTDWPYAPGEPPN
jgi:hypothetical protein